jgi:hypothetical protein
MVAGEEVQAVRLGGTEIGAATSSPACGGSVANADAKRRRATMGEGSGDVLLLERAKRGVGAGDRLRNRWLTVLRTPIVARYA